MINFVSTFPPIMCGIGTYTKYLVSQMPLENWRVTSFNLNEFFRLPETFNFGDRVSYELSLTDPGLPSSLKEKVIWFEHAFGIWGKEPSCFLKFLEDAKKKNKKVVASFHTIHFQSSETKSGMQKKEQNLLRDAFPLLDALTVFTRGAYQAVIEAFPQYQDKVVMLRHGVHLYPFIEREEAKKKLLEYLIDKPNILSQKKEELKKIYAQFLSPETVILGNLGFITADKAFSDLYRLRGLAQEKLPQHRVISLIIGKIQLRKDKKIDKSLPILQKLKSLHDGKKNLFFEHYISEEILPLAFKSLDFSVFWCHNATQSGRMSHAQGIGACIIGRKKEGIGETLKLSGLPTGETLEELAGIIQKLVLHPELKKEIEISGRNYAQQYSYGVQAKKHLLLAKSLIANQSLPLLDGVSAANRTRHI